MSAYSKRPRDFAYLSWIKSQQCIACESQRLIQRGVTYAHHAGQRAFGRKAEDRSAIPLCFRHHDRSCSTSVHALGKLFWVRFGLDRGAVVRELNERYEGECGRIAA